MTVAEAAPSPDPSPGPPAEAMRAAFRELHGRRLHGFALLLTQGDRHAAARLASEALAAGTARIGELRHPERAAAWLRRRVVERAKLRPIGPTDRHTLLELGADAAVVGAIAALDRLERAALIASAVERLDRRDVATVVGRDGSSLDRLMRQARETFTRVHAELAQEQASDGPIMTHLRTVAQRAMT